MKGFGIILAIWLGIFLTPVFAGDRIDNYKNIQVKTTWTMTLSEKEAVTGLMYWMKQKHAWQFPEECMDIYLEVTRSMAGEDKWVFQLKCESLSR